MSQDTLTFPEQFTAVTVTPETTFKEALDAMSHDVVAVRSEGRIIGTITSTMITYQLRQGEARPSTQVSEWMEPYEALTSYESPEEELRDIFYIFLFSLVRRQVDTKVFNANHRDGFLNKVFLHLHKQINLGKYESCSQRMTMSHWIRTVANNKIIDELRKIPTPETVEEFRDKQRTLGHLSNENPIRTLNEGDVMQIIHKAMESLPEKQRMALLENMKSPNLSGSEIAESMGMTLNAFHLNLNRARDKVQKVLKEYAPETVSTVINLRNKPRKTE
ncbi:hypothetical protein BVY04_05165 [bacterium M21]|nr:hypothetical protein BVY04_05165 [bacterium M21]